MYAPFRFADPSLVLIASDNPAGTHAAASRALTASQVLSVDAELARLGDLPDEPALRRDAERSLAALISARLGHHRASVVCTGLGARERAGLLALARSARVPAHMLIIRSASSDTDALCERAAGGHLTREGFASAQEVELGDLAKIRFGHGDLTDVDVIGDVHGCLDELRRALTRLGYRDLDGAPYHPAGRTAVLVGDLVDHGPDSVGVVMLVDRMVQAGCAVIGALGNHDWRLVKRLVLRRKTGDHGGLEDTLAQFHAAGSEAVDAAARLFMHAPSHSVFDQGRLVVTHGAIRPDLLGRRPVRDRDDETSEMSLYGERFGGVDEGTGLLRRSHRWISAWPADGPTVVFGHDVVGEQPKVFGEGSNVIGIDCGCASGGSLAALSWPERRAVAVPSQAPRELKLDPVAA